VSSVKWSESVRWWVRVFSASKKVYDTQSVCVLDNNKKKKKCGRWPPIELDAQADGIGGVAPTNKRFYYFHFLLLDIWVRENPRKNLEEHFKISQKCIELKPWRCFGYGYLLYKMTNWRTCYCRRYCSPLHDSSWKGDHPPEKKRGDCFHVTIK
jgi:hypothetical protein